MARRENFSVVKAGLSAKTIIGGAPVTEEFAKKARADGYAQDAGSAIQLAKRILEK